MALSLGDLQASLDVPQDALPRNLPQFCILDHLPEALDGPDGVAGLLTDVELTLKVAESLVKVFKVGVCDSEGGVEFLPY